MNKKYTLPLLIILLSIAVIFALCYLSSQRGLPINLLQQVNKLSKEAASPAEKESLNQAISITVLKNSAFVLQYVSLLFGGIALIFTILGFIGAKQILNVKKIEQDIRNQFLTLEKEHNRFKNEIKKFDKKMKLEFEFTKARLFYTQGYFEEAWNLLSKLPDDHSSELSLYKGMTLRKRNDYLDAISSFEKALQLTDADQPRIHYNIGICWLQKKVYEKALQHLEKAIDLNERYVDAYTDKAIVFRRLDKLDEAISTLKMALSIDEKNARAAYNLACYYALKANKNDALDKLKEAILLNKEKYIPLASKDSDFEKIRGDDFDNVIRIKKG